MKRMTIQLAVMLELQFRHAQRQHRSILRPTLVELDEAIQHSLVILRMILRCHDEEPRLPVVRRSRPTRRFEQTAQFLRFHRSVCKRPRTPPFSDQTVNRRAGHSCLFMCTHNSSSKMTFAKQCQSTERSPQAKLSTL